MPKESKAARKARVGRLWQALKQAYPSPKCALDHASAFQLLCATILAAQCTDARVNLVTPALFQRYPDPASLAQAETEELCELIRSTGFFNNKAKSLVGMASALVERFGGQVPSDMDSLLTLPGVARKTANVILGTWFGRNDGVVVDTHVGRLSLRLALCPSARDDKDAVKIEQDLMAVVPREAWTDWSHSLVWHGRLVCSARSPNCGGCVLSQDCPSANASAGG